jgi:hypothetical protein
MASSSSTMVNPLLSNPISEKLTKPNHAVWKAQILAVQRGARLEGYLIDAISAPPEKIKDKETMISNPAYEEWYTTDQQVLTYLLLSLSKDIMAQVVICTTAASAWTVIEGMFTSGTHALQHQHSNLPRHHEEGQRLHHRVRQQGTYLG